MSDRKIIELIDKALDVFTRIKEIKCFFHQQQFKHSNHNNHDERK